MKTLSFMCVVGVFTWAFSTIPEKIVREPKVVEVNPWALQYRLYRCGMLNNTIFCKTDKYHRRTELRGYYIKDKLLRDALSDVNRIHHVDLGIMSNMLTKYNILSCAYIEDDGDDFIICTALGRLSPDLLDKDKDENKEYSI